jgi:hypothetical protein
MRTSGSQGWPGTTAAAIIGNPWNDHPNHLQQPAPWIHRTATRAIINAATDPPDTPPNNQPAEQADGDNAP